MRRVRLLRKLPIGEFADSVYTYRERIYRLWLISPWIGMYTDGRVDPLQLMVDALRSRPKCMVNVITRKPRATQDWHLNALKVLRENVNPAMFYCDSLHTKLYIMEADALICAVLGSPNLTAGGNSENIELALEVRGGALVRNDEISNTLCDLIDYAHGLLGHESVVNAS